MKIVLVSIIDIRYITPMIRSIADRPTQHIYDSVDSRFARKIPREIHSRAQRLLDQLNAAPSLDFLRIPPGNRLEKLKGELSGYWSIRVNDQWRIVFHWKENDAFDVMIIDYHR